jgi:uncharacterized protein (TIGR00730 family)
MALKVGGARLVRRLAVFTGSTNGNDPRFAEVAREVGADLARAGIGVVYGGGHAGLMGALAEGALTAGGEVIGVIPRSMVEREWAHAKITELHVCASMHERKATMAEKADAFLALPGGLGTLEEIFEVWTWRQLGFHDKPVGFLDADGFWTPLMDTLRGIVSAGFLSPSALDDVVVGHDLTAVLDGLRRRASAAQATLRPGT